MYFPIGSVKCYNARTDSRGVLVALKFNRTKSLFIVLSGDSIFIWKTRPRVVLDVWKRKQEDISENGENILVAWKPDSSAIAVVTEYGQLMLFDVLNTDGEYVYLLEQPSSRHSVEQLEPGGVPQHKLSLRCIVKLSSPATSVSPRSEELVVATSDGLLQRVRWNGEMNISLTLSVRELPFSTDLATTSGTPLGGDNIYIKEVETSPLLGGFAVVLSDGRAGFLSSSSAAAKPSDIIGTLAKDVFSATCVCVNHKYQLIVFGLDNGQGAAYGFDEITGGLTLSHKYTLPVKDYPGNKAGEVTGMIWTPDGCAVAMTWSKGGLAVWSVFGSLLLCSLNTDFCDFLAARIEQPFNMQRIADIGLRSSKYDKYGRTYVDKL